MVKEYDINDRLKKYIHNLFNEGYILLDSHMLGIREEDRNYSYYSRSQNHEVKEALKMMSNSKAVEPNNMPLRKFPTTQFPAMERMFLSTPAFLSTTK